MSEQRLSEALGIDETAEESLARAGVRTLQELSDADVEALAMASGIPIDRIREWQQRARRAGARVPKRSPVATAWMVAIIGLAIAVVLGWAMMNIGGRRIREAEKLKVATESKLNVAVSFAAREAMEELRRGRLAIRSQNWGSAQTILSEVKSCVGFMVDVAPEDRAQHVRAIADAVEALQGAAAEQAGDTLDRLDALEADLDKLAQEG
jgi:hypothetical protein